MKRPLVILTVIFSLGIIFANTIEVYFIIFYSLALCTFILSCCFFKKYLLFKVFLCSMVFSLGAASLLNAKILPKHHISNFIFSKNNTLYSVGGYINSFPDTMNNKTAFIFRVKYIQINNLRLPSSGDMLVFMKQKNNFRFGEELILKGHFYHQSFFSNNNSRGFKAYLYNRSIHSIMRVNSNLSFVRLNKFNGSVLRKFAFFLKARVETLLFKHLSRLSAGILEAMVLGEKSNLPGLIYNSMVKSGTVHILVVSGFNVGIVAFITTLMLKIIRIPRSYRFYIALSVLVIYAFMTGASNPVVRATIMASVFMFSFMVRREPDIYNSLSIAMLTILNLNPKQLFDAGFQLSFASVISIVSLYPALRSVINLNKISSKSLKFLIDGCLVSFSAWLGTLCFIAYYFRIISPIAVLANIFIVPLATLITLCGFSLIFASLILPTLTPLFASASEVIVGIMLKINTLLVRLPGAYFYLP